MGIPVERSRRAAAVAAEPVAAPPRFRTLDLSRTGPWFAAFLVLALVAIWPTYLSRLGASSAYTHLHAGTAAVWMACLVVQPDLIRARRLDLHRVVGRASYVVAPVILGLTGTAAWQTVARWFAGLPLT